MAIEIAEHLEEPIVTAWKAEFEDYWDYFDKARNRDTLKDERGNVYLPVTMKGEQQQLLQRGAWAFLQSIYPGRIFETDDVLMQDIPTSFGHVSLSVCTAEGGQSGSIRIIPPEREPPKKIVLHLEHFEWSVQSVLMNGDEILDRTVLTDADKDILLTLNFK